MTVATFVADDPAPEDLAAIAAALGAFNAGEVGPDRRQPLAVALRAAEGPLLGGLAGHTAWGWLYVQQLWLSAPLRGQGWAGRLLALAEARAAARGCHGAWIDTFNPVALRAYRRAGYRDFGALPDFPRGRARVFLYKSLRAAPDAP